MILALCPIAASASPLLWTISGLGLDTGALANGSFDFNADTGAFSSIDVTITGGSNSFFDGTYDTLAPNPPFDSTATEFFFVTGTSGLTGTPIVAIALDSTMTDAGGTIAVAFADLGTCLNSTCTSVIGQGHNASPEGSVSAVPEPAIGAPLAFVLIGLSAMNCKLRRPAKRG